MLLSTRRIPNAANFVCFDRTLEAEVTINNKCLMGTKRNLGKVAFLKEFIFMENLKGD